MKKISIILILFLIILSSCATSEKCYDGSKTVYNPKPKKLKKTDNLPHASNWSYTSAQQRR